LCLSGYSFGGCVAWEAGRRLALAGRRISFLGLIDTQNAGLRWPDKSGARRSGRLSGITRALRGIRLLGSFLGRWKLTEIALEKLVTRRSYWALRGIDRALGLLPATMSFWLRLRFLEHLRAIALKQWGVLASADIPLTLFRADSFPENPPDLGWSGVTSDLAIVHVGGSHYLLERPQERQRLCAAFVEELQASEEPATAHVNAGPIAPDLTATQATSPTVVPFPHPPA
jgi:thioesterase domain-containing protein